MFDSSSNLNPLPTLHNCFLFGNVSNTSHETSGFEFASNLHFVDGERNKTADNVARVLEDCFSSYCDTLPNCPEEYSQYSDKSTLWSEDEWSDTYTASGEPYLENTVYGRGYYLVHSICEFIPARINPEVGGIGVSPFP